MSLKDEEYYIMQFDLFWNYRDEFIKINGEEQANALRNAFMNSRFKKQLEDKEYEEMILKYVLELPRPEPPSFWGKLKKLNFGSANNPFAMAALIMICVGFVGGVYNYISESDSLNNLGEYNLWSNIIWWIVPFLAGMSYWILLLIKKLFFGNGKSNDKSEKE